MLFLLVVHCDQSFKSGKEQVFYSGTCESDEFPIYAGSGSFAGAEGTLEVVKSGSRKIVYSADFCT